MADARRGARAVVRVVYALPDEQVAVEVPFEEGMTVADAVSRSHLSNRFADIAGRPLVCAIHGQAAPPTRLVRAGDRVEILRPLTIDPKEGRRLAAARAKAKKV